MSRASTKRDQQKYPRVHAEEADAVVFQERPKICLVDIDANAKEALTSAGFNCTAGSLGSLVKVPNAKMGDRRICRLNYAIPSNLHEYDIVVIDLKDREPIQYDPSQHQLRDSREPSQLFFHCGFPQTIFDPRPVAGSELHSTIKEIQGKESIVIVFATSSEDLRYQPVELTAGGYGYQGSFTCDNYSFLPSKPPTDNKIGSCTTVIAKGTKLDDFLQKHNQEFTYSIAFSHPTHWEGTQAVKNPNFMPLVANLAGEIVSYVKIDSTSILFVFPQLEDKVPFLLELFQMYLPAIAPNLFPFSTRFAWLNDEEYQLPGEVSLLTEKRSLEQEYTERIAAKGREVEENHQKYQFLHDLLTETGEKLVKAVELYFHWLGFDDVVNCDEVYPERKEEDLQVSLENGLLVVEVKGIGGTSTDSDCLQISKIKHRREKERKSFNVSALYIVNHQRYLPPENRTNPPFTEQQIKDAKNDERGLLTTYDLFKLYSAVDSGFITKEDARKSVLDFGLVTFKPSNSTPIGRPLEIHHNGTVGIFLLQDVTVRLDEKLLIYEDGRGRAVKIVSLQDHGRDVAEASKGEIGIKFSDKITQKSELWKPEAAFV